MARPEATLPILPAAGDKVAIEAAGIVTKPGTFVTARNTRFRDDLTPERRPGFYSQHFGFDDEDSKLDLEGLDPDEMEVQGIHYFDRGRRTRTRAACYLVKIGDYVLGSQCGEEFDMPLAQGLGTTAVPAFVDFYLPSKKEIHCVLLSDDRGWHPAAWNGRYDAHNDTLPAALGGGAVAGGCDREPWGYFRPIQDAPYAKFGRVHNRRLWLAGNDPYEVYYSQADDYRDFSNGGVLTMDPRWGRVTGFFPSYYGELFIGQEHAISRVTFDAFGEPASLYPITTEDGLRNNRCIVRIGDDFLYHGTKPQIRRLSTTEKYGDILFYTEGFKIHKDLDKTPPSANRWSFAVDDPEEGIVWFGMSKGGGEKNDALYGYDYNRDRWLEDENKSIGGFSCGETWMNAQFGKRKKAHFGAYLTKGTNAGRIWTHNQNRKEDIYLYEHSYPTYIGAPYYETPWVVVPTVGMPPAGVNNMGTDFETQGLYDHGLPGLGYPQTTIRIRADATGTVGTTVGLTATWWDLGPGAAATGTLTIDNTYVPGTWLNVVSSVQVRWTGGTVITEGQEVWILSESCLTIFRTLRADLPDVGEGLRFNRLGDGGTYNFLPVLETVDLNLANGNQEMEVKGITFYTRVVGNRADDRVNSDTNDIAQNQFRFFLDAYLLGDQDKDWTQIHLLDGNAAQRYHLNESLSESAGDHMDRPDLQIVLPVSDLEADGDAMAREEDVNIEYVEINRSMKTFRLRFDQATMAGQYDVVTAGAHDGDFNLLGFVVHMHPAKRGSQTMTQGTMSRHWDLPGV